MKLKEGYKILRSCLCRKGSLGKLPVAMAWATSLLVSVGVTRLLPRLMSNDHHRKNWTLPIPRLSKS